MTVTPTRLLRLTAIITVIAFLLSGALRNARHGVALVAGDVCWYTFLLGLLTTLVLSAAVIIGMLRRRRQPQRPTA
jgi:hypothetical protein